MSYNTRWRLPHSCGVILQATATLNAVDDVAKIEKSCCYIFDPIHSYPARHAPSQKRVSHPCITHLSNHYGRCFCESQAACTRKRCLFCSHAPMVRRIPNSHGCAPTFAELSCNNNRRSSDTWQQLSSK